MPEKRRLSLSFSLAQREQRDAWERLSAVAPGQRMEAVCRMINGYMEQQELLEAVRRTIREELTGVSFTKTTTQPEQAGAVDEDVLGFLRALQGGDDNILFDFLICSSGSAAFGRGCPAPASSSALDTAR